MSLGRVHSKGNVPFSWENKPGISKAMQQEKTMETKGCDDVEIKLPPPPCLTDSPKVAALDFQIPLPPCAFQPPSRCSSKKGLRRQEDPFLAAFKKCTKTVTNGKLPGDGKITGIGPRGGRKTTSIFSCKHSCAVRDDNVVRLSDLHPVYRGAFADRDVRATKNQKREKQVG